MTDSENTLAYFYIALRFSYLAMHFKSLKIDSEQSVTVCFDFTFEDCICKFKILADP